MNNCEVAGRLLGIAKRIALPMQRIDPYRAYSKPILARLRDKAGISRNAKLVWRSFLTMRSEPGASSDNNKYHFFAVFEDGEGRYVGGNAWGRIGYLRTGGAKILVEGAESIEDAKNAMKRHYRGKISKGYEITKTMMREKTASAKDKTIALKIVRLAKALAAGCGS